ncbi:acid protease [Stereum hirsutum FP-91666 SS1]|uniref:acid protease n=1 Tax=Stereum hirsutum (strain FP-91666) TaxID=721885 RepID=UPI000444939C|nr:acid protease [Stereum hirsutum FP-91666 SS1]EIM84055.1 acid protease [Stereum hirsutum FP-91666 SS1]
MIFLFVSGLAALLASVSAVPSPLVGKGGGNGVHLPIRRSVAGGLERRAFTGKTGLGDDADVTYNVMVKVGSVETPVVLDTGSSDLWILSDACSNCSSTASIPLYPTSSFQNSGLSVQLLYGDSQTGTHADGPIGKDTAGVAGLTLDGQYFAAISDTNTSVLETGSAGIFGLGFPINSVIFNTLLQKSSPTSSNRRSDLSLPPFIRSRSPSFSTRIFPSFSFLKTPPPPSLPSLSSRAPSISVPDVLAGFTTYGPLIPRLALTNSIPSPLITITLQRDAFDIGGNAGMLSIGELPGGVDPSAVSWVPVRGYNKEEGGLPGPGDSPGEVYPLTWEVFLDDVYFDGQKLPRSNLSSSNISLSALIDTGNSLIRGPSDVLSTIASMISSSSSDANANANTNTVTYPCSEPHTLAFEIGGRMFPVDPRDFGTQVSSSSSSSSSSSGDDGGDGDDGDDEDGDGSEPTCSFNLAVTDPPGSGGFLYSWSLGDPFLKSALVSFYYGNLTYPSQDQPRVGLLSTVPEDANEELEDAVKEAEEAGRGLPEITQSAPTGTADAASTNSLGVAQATASASSSGGGSGSTSGGVSLRIGFGGGGMGGGIWEAVGWGVGMGYVLGMMGWV